MTQYEWDFRNRLVQVTERDEFDAITQVVGFIYDVFDRRIGKLVDTTSPFDMVDAVIERYVHDDASGVASLAGGNVVLDFVDPDGDGQAPMQLNARYLYGAAVDQILAKEDLAEALQDPERVLWHLADHLGTTRDLVDHEGALVEHYEYDSFGNVVSGDTSLTRYLFTGREWDADVDLQYSRARWTTRRWGAGSARTRSASRPGT